MRRVHATFLAFSAVGILSGCTDYLTDGGSGSRPTAPTGLFYQLEPSGTPQTPAGIVLRWNVVGDANLSVYNIYSRNSSTGAFGLRGSTTSPSFHDDGAPALEYYVTAEDYGGGESDPSSSVVIDEHLALQAPATLTSISLNGAIHLQWADNAYLAAPNAFLHYRVYSAGYDLDSNLCGTSWSLEGSTVAPTFLAGALVNGQPKCFAVSAISVEGYESLWSPKRYDTPRPDAHAQILYTQAGDPLRSGFRFFLDANNDGKASPLELGLISSGSSPNVDFTLTPSGAQFMITPVRAAAQVQQYGTQPITDLTDIDIAPVSGYSHAAVLAQPGSGYVFQMNEGDGFFRYGSMRVTATGANYVIFDWAYQTDPGNPELLRALSTAGR